MCLKEGPINIFFLKSIDLLKIIIWLIFLEGILMPMLVNHKIFIHLFLTVFLNIYNPNDWIILWNSIITTTSQLNKAKR